MVASGVLHLPLLAWNIYLKRELECGQLGPVMPRVECLPYEKRSNRVLLAELTRTLVSAAQCWRGWEMLPAWPCWYYTIFLLGSWGEREPHLLGHPCLEWSFLQAELRMGWGRRKWVTAQARYRLSLFLLRFSRLFFNKCLFTCYMILGQRLETLLSLKRISTGYGFSPVISLQGSPQCFLELDTLSLV